jgi:DNA-3-methyladenine glycosylase
MAEVKRLEKAFFMRNDVDGLANDLIGKILVTNMNGHHKSGIIVETEAYSYKEKACHTYNNKRTKRTETLFREGGTVYVYLCYGIHHLFNIVTNIEGKAEAVLIRAIQPLNGFSSSEITDRKRVTSGPGKLSKAMGINTTHNNVSLLDNLI